MKTILFVITLIILPSFSYTVEKTGTEQEIDDFGTNDSLYIAIDTVFPNNNSLCLIGNYYTEELIMNIHTTGWDTIFDFTKAFGRRTIKGFGPYDIIWTCDTYVGIRVSCGASCYYDNAIPIKSGYETESFFIPLIADNKFNLAKNLIAYMSVPAEGDAPMVVIRNLITGKKDSISIDPDWEAGMDITDYVDTISATNIYFMIGRKDPNGEILFKKEKNVDLK